MALVLALPFVLLSLLAQGTMVAAGPTPDSFMVVLCGDHRPVEMVLDDSGDLVPIDEYRGTHPSTPPQGAPVCDWALHAQPVLDAAPPPVLPGQRLARPLSRLTALPQRAALAETPAALARGPPLL